MRTAENLYRQLSHVKIGADICKYSKEKCEELAPTVDKILELKSRQNAVILAHSYVAPEILCSVADYTGDSFGLSLDAQKTDADIIVFCAVRFMAETAKILNPNKKVFVPSTPNGCTLADSVDGEKVRRLRREFPDYTFVCYINTTAEVKAECDVCVTSSNVYKIIERLPNDKIYFLPDNLMGKNLQEEMEKRGTKKKIEIYDGVCYVHEQYDPEILEFIKIDHPAVKVLSHPECSPGVLHQSDFTGSTSQMIDYVKKSDAESFFILTECGLISRLQLEVPEKKFVGSCSLCRYMKANNLDDILRVMENPNSDNEIVLEESTRLRALKSLEAMYHYAGT